MAQYPHRGYGGNRSSGGSPGGGRPGGGFSGGAPGPLQEAKSAPRPEVEDRDLADLLKPPVRVSYFLEGSGAARKELFDQEARRVAQDLANDDANERKVPSSQLRRFYSEVMALKRRLELDRDKRIPDAEIQARLALLKAEAAYTFKRGRYRKELVRFFTRHAEFVQNRDDFERGFQPHFEAVIAFHKFYEKDKGDNP